MTATPSQPTSSRPASTLCSVKVPPTVNEPALRPLTVTSTVGSPSGRIACRRRRTANGRFATSEKVTVPSARPLARSRQLAPTEGPAVGRGLGEGETGQGAGRSLGAHLDPSRQACLDRAGSAGASPGSAPPAASQPFVSSAKLDHAFHRMFISCRHGPAGISPRSRLRDLRAGRCALTCTSPAPAPAISSPRPRPSWACGRPGSPQSCRR